MNTKTTETGMITVPTANISNYNSGSVTYEIHHGIVMVSFNGLSLTTTGQRATLITGMPQNKMIFFGGFIGGVANHQGDAFMENTNNPATIVMHTNVPAKSPVWGSFYYPSTRYS